MRRLQTWLGIGISALFLFFAFRSVNLGAVGRSILHANYLWLTLGVVLGAVSIAVRARRWQVLFTRARGLRFSHTFGVLNVGYLVNDVLPLRAGELVRAYLLGQIEPVSRVETLSTIVVERAIDTLAVIIMLAAVAPFVAIPAGAVRPLLLLTALVVILFLVLVIAAARRALAMALIERLAMFLPLRLRRPAVRHVDSAIDGLAVFTDPLAAIEVIALTAVIYLLLTGAIATLLLAFHIHLGTAGVFFLLATATLGLVIPSSPGYVGVWEGVIVATLVNVFALDRNLAASFALVSHVALFLPPVAFAAIYLWRSSATWNAVLSFGRATRAEQATLSLPD